MKLRKKHRPNFIFISATGLFIFLIIPFQTTLCMYIYITAIKNTLTSICNSEIMYVVNLLPVRCWLIWTQLKQSLNVLLSTGTFIIENGWSRFWLALLLKLGRRFSEEWRHLSGMIMTRYFFYNYIGKQRHTWW